MSCSCAWGGLKSERVCPDVHCVDCGACIPGAARQRRRCDECKEVRAGEYTARHRSSITEVCEIPSCESLRANGSTPWCAMHYSRERRHGHPLLVLLDGRGSVNSNGYRVLTRRDHPLATADGKVYEHRLVLFAVVGPGSHLCGWCRSAVVTWGIDLEVDHLDGDKLNNTPANLIPCCHACNSWRTKLRNTNGAAR